MCLSVRLALTTTGHWKYLNKTRQQSFMAIFGQLQLSFIVSWNSGTGRSSYCDLRDEELQVPCCTPQPNQLLSVSLCFDLLHDFLPSLLWLWALNHSNQRCSQINQDWNLWDCHFFKKKGKTVFKSSSITNFISTLSSVFYFYFTLEETERTFRFVFEQTGL